MNPLERLEAWQRSGTVDEMRMWELRSRSTLSTRPGHVCTLTCNYQNCQGIADSADEAVTLALAQAAQPMESQPELPRGGWF